MTSQLLVDGADAPAQPAPSRAADRLADRMARRLGRVSTAMTLFVVFLCLALVALDVLLAVRARDAELRQADVATTNLARSVARQTNAMASEIEHVLNHVIYELERQEITDRALEQLQPLLVTQAASIGQIHDLFVYGADGRWLVSSQPLAGANRNNSDRDYFAFHRDNPSQRMRIGTPIVSRSTGVRVVPLSRRLNDADGRFAGVVLATVQVDHLLRMLSEFDIGRHGAIALFLDSGELLARRPYVEQDLGRSIAGSALHDEMVERAAGRITMRSPLDHVLRRVSYQRLADQPLQVTVALAEDELLTVWRHATYVQTAVILVLCALTALAGSFLVRAIRHRGRVEARLHQAQRELRDANARLTHLSQHDGLTGLPNRRSFDEHLARTVAQAMRSHQPVAVVMLDVDHFKRYNDRYGHPAGDRCLQAVAAAVAAAARRPGDLVARYGGEEMAAVLPNPDAAGARTVAEAMRLAVSALAIEHADHPPAGRVTVSIGVSVEVPDRRMQDAAADILRNADAALYRAKSGGRDRVEVRQDAA
jgi:diguanylate cyclase (GGDEF)-like protein